MAISLVDGFGSRLTVRKDEAAIDDGNEKIFAVNPSLRTTLHVVSNTAEYQIKLSAMGGNPTNFTDFADAEASNLTITKLYQFDAGLTHIGVDVVSGDVDIYVVQVEQ